MSGLYNIVCLSNQLWLKEYWTNKSHVASRLSKLGHKVLFVEPPINAGNIFLRQVLSKTWSVKRLLTKTYIEKTSGVLVYSPLNVLPFSGINAKFHCKKIKRISNKFFDKERKTLLWVYHVQLKNLFDYIENISHDFLIYDCVDNYLGFPENKAFYSTTVSKTELVVQEEKLAKMANVVFATAPGLVERLKNFNSETYFTPNVGDYEKFKDSKKLTPPSDVSNIKRPIVGFSGALDEHKFDLELFKKAAKELSEFSFVLIGSLVRHGKNVSKESLGLADFDNVYLLGPRPYNDMPSYYAAFDVFIIPYVLNDLTVGGCFPVKFHDALAAGLPVVVTDLPVYKFFEDVCYISKTADEFVENIKKAFLENSLEKVKQRQEVAKNNNWDGKVQNMLNIINSKI